MSRDIVIALLALLCLALLTLIAIDGVRRRRQRLTTSPHRILFPFGARALSIPALDATLRLAKSQNGVLVPAVLVRVPLYLPRSAPVPRQAEDALPLLEAVEQRAYRNKVPVDSRIERGRTFRHALRELMEHEPFDLLVVAADTEGTEGFTSDDVAWLLDNAEGEIIVLRPAKDEAVFVPLNKEDHRN
jgi:hypothetical protein